MVRKSFIIIVIFIISSYRNGNNNINEDRPEDSMVKLKFLDVTNPSI